MTRIATVTFFRQFNNTLAQQQSSIAELQQQVSLGKRILKPSDDPAGAARALDITQSLGRLEQFNRNAIFAEQRLSLEESSLSSFTNILQRARELAITASNVGTQSEDTFSAFEAELLELFQEMLNIANTRDASGDFLFAGFQGGTEPFSVSGSNVIYHGDQGQRFLQVGANKEVATGDSGYTVFQEIRNGNGKFSVALNAANTGNAVIAPGSVTDATVYQPQDFTIRFTSATTYDVINTTTATTIITGATYTEGDVISFNGLETSISGAPQTGDEFFVQTSRLQSAFTTMQNFITAVSAFPSSDADLAQYRQAIQSIISDIDQTIGNATEVITGIGARMNAVDLIQEENDAITFELQKTLSSIQDLDFAEAIGSLEFQLSALEASQQSFVAIQSLSLFNFLR